MKISQLIKHLEIQQQTLGDLEVTMQATLLSNGYSATNSPAMPDVFESTIETSIKKDGGKLGERLKLTWKM